MKTWFEDLTGISESSPDHVRSQLDLDGSTVTSRANGRRFEAGSLSLPSLEDLRRQVASLELPSGRPSITEVVGNAADLHATPSNAGALFQVASQFNVLEMAGPDVVPDAGIGIYEYDKTQGPACAIAAGAGTIYRNYLVPNGDQIGQSRGRQIDCSADLGRALGNDGERLWKMTNGYLLPSSLGLAEITKRLAESTEGERDVLRGMLRIGLQSGTQVTLGNAQHLVSQAFCSALPVAYSRLPRAAFEPFARLVLEAAYEATMCAAAINSATTGNPRVFLTSLGGGAFGNDSSWIRDSIERAIGLCRAPLQVAIVSYRQFDPGISALVRRLKSGP